MMFKQLYITALCFTLISCSAQTNPKNPQNSSQSNKSNTQNSTNNPTNSTSISNSEIVDSSNPIKISKPPITKISGFEFYKTNVGDAKKNDNTISYGSIVSANPTGFKVTKDYFPSLGQNFRIRYVILHYTALPDDKSITVLTERGVSSHYLVNNKLDNEIYQFVDENKRSYHAGVSAWRNDKSLNDTSIGIEIVNDGFKLDSLKQRVFPPFSDHQVRKIGSLVKDIADRYEIPATNILAHSDIAPLRKQDPGPMFPWKKLYDDYKIGMWYEESTKNKYFNQLLTTDFTTQSNSSQFIFKVQTALKGFGYDINPTGTWDKDNKLVVEAFQFHFRPQKFDGIVDAETWAILQALIDKYPSK